MPVRPGMAALISRTRLLISDDSQVFSDSEIQDALDVHRYLIFREELQALPTYTSTATEYRDYASEFEYLEDDTGGSGSEPPSFQDSSAAAVTWTSKDFLTGHFTKASPGIEPPVYFTGRAYDLYAASADLLEAWAAKVKLDFDFSTGGDSFTRSQKADALLALAATYRRRARLTVSTAERSDTR